MIRKQLANCLRLVAAIAIVLIPWSSSAMAQAVHAPSDTSTVHVGSGGFTFAPNPQTVEVGDTVHWVWDGFNHSATSGSCSGTTCTPDNLWDSGVHDSGFTFDFTFTQTGTYNYYCTVHGPFSNMSGTIFVVNTFGLSASNSSPTSLGSETAFTATVSSGSNLTYTWDFGDGHSGTGITTTHTYAAFGDYTATVTATNSISTGVASTAVMVLGNLYLPSVSR